MNHQNAKPEPDEYARAAEYVLINAHGRAWLDRRLFWRRIDDEWRRLLSSEWLDVRTALQALCEKIQELNVK